MRKILVLLLSLALALSGYVPSVSFAADNDGAPAAQETTSLCSDFGE